MLGVKVALKDAEKVKKIIMENNVIDNSYRYKKEKNYMIFPVLNADCLINTPQAEIVHEEFEENETKNQDMKTILSSSLTPDELSVLKTAHDTVGTIAILEIDEILRPKEKIIAQALLDSVNSIKTVLRKDGGHEGEFRVQKMKWLAGEKTKETVQIENGVKLKLNVETVYYSPRLSTERKRIYEQVKKGETILVMFSGCAPFPIVIAKNTQAKEVVGIEINPQGHDYGVENIKLNKLQNVVLINDDVKNAIPLLAEKGITFDRIVMPAPHNAEDFISEALSVAKKGTTIHFYDFLHEDNFKDAEDKVEKACKESKRTWKMISLNKCGQHAPQVFRICLDFEVTN